MNLRLATLDDLPKIKTMYRQIIALMHQKGLPIWDEFYPCEFFACDIEKHRLHLLVDCTDTIVAAFALCESNSGEPYVTWENRHGKAFYLERLGVSAAYPRCGLGSKALQTAMALAKQCRLPAAFCAGHQHPGHKFILQKRFSASRWCLRRKNRRGPYSA